MNFPETLSNQNIVVVYHITIDPPNPFDIAIEPQHSNVRG